MSDGKREVVAEYSTYYVCDVHGWDFTDEEGDVCPVCYGEHLAEQRIIKLLEELDRHGTTHSEFCAARHAYASKAIERIKGENK